MRFALYRDARRFSDEAAALLSSRPEANLLATILMGILDGLHAEPPPLFAVGFDPESGEATWAALRTPPRPMVATPGLPAGAAEELVARWLAEDPDMTGVNSVPATARPLAAALSAQTGRPAAVRMSMALHSLERVSDPPHPAAGELRQAGPRDRSLLVSWWEAVAREVFAAGAGLAALDARLQNGGMYVWEVDGEPVSMAGHAPAVAGVVRLGPVYTPPGLRGRGYAGTAVAALSRRVLAGGARGCILFTDLANPTSNKIYAEIGYRRVADWEEHELA